MDVIKRSAVIVVPGEPLLDWLRQSDSTSSELKLEDLRREPTWPIDRNFEEFNRGSSTGSTRC